MAHDLRGQSVAVNTLQLDLMVWTEGFAATLGDPAAYSMEDAVIMSDAILWMAKQPLEWTGHLETITTLRAKAPCAASRRDEVAPARDYHWPPSMWKTLPVIQAAASLAR